MGKPLRVALYASLRAIGTEHRARVATRSKPTNGAIKCFTRGKCTEFKPTCVARRAQHRSPIFGNTKSILLASQQNQLTNQGDHHHHRVSSAVSTPIKQEVVIKPEPVPSTSSASVPTSSGRRLELPAFRIVGRMEPLRSTPRLNDEVFTDETYLKRHEKYERQEKTIKRRDQKWQREEQYRLHLMKISKEEAPPRPRISEIEVVTKRPKPRRH